MQADVTQPWQRLSTQTPRGRIRRGGVRRYSLSLLDGAMVASVSAPRGAVVSLSYRGRTIAGPARRVHTTVCGDVPLTVTVKARGAGRYTLAVAAS